MTSASRPAQAGAFSGGRRILRCAFDETELAEMCGPGGRTIADFMNHAGPILFAEDDENDAFIFRIALQKAGIRNALIHVADGEDAINYMAGAGPYSDREKSRLPCLVVTDLKMPRRTGFDLLAWINQQPPSHRPAVVVLSGSFEDSDQQRALALGAAAYYKKPAGLDKMVHITQQLKNAWLTRPAE